MTKKIVIIHFQPLEYFPPALNLIDYLSANSIETKLTIITTEPDKNTQWYGNNKVKIIRYKKIIPNSGAFIKLYRYFTFYIGAFLNLIIQKPSSVLYYETLSSLPAIWYRKLRKLRLLAHYHEIVTLDELNDGRYLNKLLNKIEARYYNKYNWISQTNKSRLEIFSTQYQLKNAEKVLKILPNYPPESWVRHQNKLKHNQNVIKLLHVGSISTKGMYLNELLNEFGSKPQFTIDFYSHNISNEVAELISQHSNCKVKGAIDYSNIIQLKGCYDVGLVLYSGESLNFIYNAPNKIFEYLALDLDVWCSDKLITAKEYERLDCYPKMIMVDFTNFKQFDIENARSRKDLKYVPSSFTYESVYSKLISYLQTDFNQ